MINKFLAIACVLLCCTKSYAQTMDLKRDTVITVSSDRYAVQTNKFWDNWYIGAGGGALIFFGDHNKQQKFGERLSPNFNFYLGKSFSPGVGIRAGISGFKIVGLTQNGSHSTGEQYGEIPWEGFWLYKQEFNFYHIHADAMFNVTNLVAGFDEDRFYHVSPYLGLGWMVSRDEPIEREVSANIGVLNSFKLSKGLDLTLDVRGSMVNDRFDGELGGRRNEGFMAASIGLQYKFNKRNWSKPITTTITYDDAEFLKILDQIKKLADDNESLREQLAKARDTTITNIEVKKNMLAAPILVTFPINKSTVSNEARVNLGFFAKLIKETSPDITYSITGYADEGTGTPTINERLSRERADAIYDVLVKEFDVNPKQLKKHHKGGVANMYYNDPRLSRAVITIADILINE